MKGHDHKHRGSYTSRLYCILDLDYKNLHTSRRTCQMHGSQSSTYVIVLWDITSCTLVDNTNILEEDAASRILKMEAAGPCGAFVSMCGLSVVT
jgi:hypothetical protein